jgi:predicted PurR-regulated permease PerM
MASVLSEPGSVTEKSVSPDSDPADALGLAARWATIGVFVLLFGAALYLAHAVLIPVVAATIVGLTLTPWVRRAEEHHVPAWAFALLVIALLIVLLQVSVLLFVEPVGKWIERAPEFAAILKDQLQAPGNALALFRGLGGWLSDGGGLKIDIGAVVSPVVSTLTPALSELIIFVATLFFVLISHADLRRSLILAFPGRDARLNAIRILNNVEEDLAHYAATVTVINLCLGSLTAIVTAIVGLPNAPAWGILAFLCNFVPYIGPAFVLCILFGVGLVNFQSFADALVAPAVYVAMTTLEGHFITPNIIGRRFTLSPLAVFLALVFWTWLWGPVGGFLAVPITIIAIVVYDQVFSEAPELPG